MVEAEVPQASKEEAEAKSAPDNQEAARHRKRGGVQIKQRRKAA